MVKAGDLKRNLSFVYSGSLTEAKGPETTVFTCVAVSGNKLFAMSIKPDTCVEATSPK